MKWCARGWPAGILATLALAGAVQVQASDAESPRVDFQKEIAPIVQRCQPCHFPGGSMYARLPFDRAETIQKLGVRLFTRIKGPKEQALIQRFLDQKETTARAKSTGAGR